MPRYPQPRPLDRPARRDLDGGWIGVDCRRDRSLLGQGGPGDAPGLLADAANVRISRQQPETRRGCVQPIHFNAPGTRSSIQGVGIFSDPNGDEWLVTADVDRLWFHADGRTPRSVLMPGGVTLERCELIQAFQNLLICRGPDLPVLEWEGHWHRRPRVVAASPVPPAQTDYLVPLPGVSHGLVMSDRFVFPVGRDTFGWSDILDYTRYDPDLSVGRVNSGEDDAIVAFARYQGNRLIVFKDQSIYYVNNFYGDLGSISVDRLPARIGCVARRTVCEVGGDLMWLGDRGVYRLSQTEQDALRSHPVPVSQPIERYMERIHWTYAADAAACVVGPYYILAVPMDGSTRNNAFLVYDLTQGTWQGVDWYGAAPPGASNHNVGTASGGLPPTAIAQILCNGEPVTYSGEPLTYSHSTQSLMLFVESSPTAGGDETIHTTLVMPPDVMAQALVVTDYAGERTAFVADGHRLVALGHGTTDRLNGQEYGIVTAIETRGYLMGELGEKGALALEVFYATRDARLNLSVRTDGVNEVLPVVRNRLRDRRRYRIHGRPRYSLDNTHADFEGPHREDYTFIAGDGPVLPPPGIRLELWQEYKDPVPVRRLGRWFSLRLESMTGQVRLLGVQLDALPEHHSFATRT